MYIYDLGGKWGLIALGIDWWIDFYDLRQLEVLNSETLIFIVFTCPLTRVHLSALLMMIFFVLFFLVSVHLPPDKSFEGFKGLGLCLNECSRLLTLPLTPVFVSFTLWYWINQPTTCRYKSWQECTEIQTCNYNIITPTVLTWSKALVVILSCED